MNPDVKISIIIPVYNVEKYLVRCIESVLDQDFINYEIILVNDGSTDSSLEICKSYEKKYRFIKVYNQENKGLSEARNKGIIESTGDFVLFLDSDDFLEKDSLKKLIDIPNISNMDLIVGCAYTVTETGEKKEKIEYSQIKEGLYSRDEYLNKVINKDFPQTYCAQFTICNKNFLKQNNLLFYPGILHEDELWTPQIILKAKNIYFKKVFFYDHFVREGSIMHSKNYEKKSASLEIVNRELEKTLEKYNLAISRGFRNRIVYNYLRSYTLSSNPKHKRKQISKRYLLKNAFFKREKLKSLFYVLCPSLYYFYSRKSLEKN